MKNINTEAGKAIRGVYLIHFSRPYKHARHYLGYAENIDARLNEHRNGTGARLTHVVIGDGIELILARVWPGRDRTFERFLKNTRCVPNYCPECRRCAK